MALGRYAVFGLTSLALLPFFWRKTLVLTAGDWAKAATLSIVGNLVYYILLAAAIQRIDVPAPTIIIGLLPLTIPLLTNWHQRELPWRVLAAPLLVITIGLILVNAREYQRLGSVGQGFEAFATGLGLATAALACWTWYGIANARWLRSRPHIDAGVWTTAQGIALLPITAIGFAKEAGFFGAETGSPVVGEVLSRFLLVSVIVGLASSWFATLCWTKASRSLPTTLAGQLIVFETVAAVAYGYLYRGNVPSPVIMVGVAFLCVGVALGVRAVAANNATP